MLLLNLDAGEYATEPDELWALADVLCVACGGHAGDETSMTRAVTFVAARPAIALGAHPSYPDREHFGRRSRPDLAGAALTASLVEQCQALAEIAVRNGVSVLYAKPHGALYHDASRDPRLARLVVDAARSVLGSHVTIIGPPRGALADAAGARYLREAFADRRARPDGTLVPRDQAGALIFDPADAVARARELMSVGGVDTICCHADTPNAMPIVTAVRAAITEVL